MAYKKLIKVSNVCQLLDKSKYPATGTMNGITFTNNGDGTITANGTATYVINLIILEGFPIKKNHKYLILDCTGSTSRTNYSTWLKSKLGAIVCDSADKPIGNLTYNDDKCIVFVRVENDITVSNLTFKPQLFDLTEMYGAGNEPTTVEQFRQDFPDEMYDYSPYCWLTSYKRVFMCKTKNLFDKNNFKYINGYIYSGASSIRETIDDKTLVIPCKPNTTYTFSKQEIVPKRFDRLCIAETSVENPVVGTEISNLQFIGEPPTKNEITITTTSTAKNLIVTIGLFVHQATSFEDILETCQLELGDTATDYVPYGYLTSYQRNLTCKTKNLLSFPYYGQYKTKQGITFSKVSTYKVNASGINTGSTGCTFDFNYNKVFKAGTYTIKFYTEGSVPPELYYRIRKDSYYGGTIISDKEFQKTFTLSEDTVLFISFGIYGTGAPQYTGKKINVNVWCQIEKGNTATDYVPYGHL